MSALPSIEWGEEERREGAVSFAQHLKDLTSTHTPVSSTVEKINSVVATVMPQLVEALQEELVTTSTTTPTTTVMSTGSTSLATTPSLVADKLNKVVAAVVPQLVEVIQDELTPTSTTSAPEITTAVVPHTPPPTCGAPPEPQVGKLFYALIFLNLH
jgi:ABC-type transporter Mla subunit MlaD